MVFLSTVNAGFDVFDCQLQCDLLKMGVLLQPNKDFKFRR